MRRAAALPLLPLLVAVTPASADGAGGWTWPVEGELVTRYRNSGDPYAGGQHRGIDIAAPEGRTVRAATAGAVTFADTVGSSGLTISVRTADGRFDTSYLHLSSASVRKGDAVGAGDRIGAVGTSGRGSIPRPHLHFGVRTAGSDHAYRDPLDFLPGPHPAEPPPPPIAAPRVAPPGPARVPRQRGAPVPERRPAAETRARAPADAPAFGAQRAEVLRPRHAGSTRTRRRSLGMRPTSLGEVSGPLRRRDRHASSPEPSAPPRPEVGPGAGARGPAGVDRGRLGRAPAARPARRTVPGPAPAIATAGVLVALLALVLRRGRAGRPPLPRPAPVGRRALGGRA